MYFSASVLQLAKRCNGQEGIAATSLVRGAGPRSSRFPKARSPLTSSHASQSCQGARNSEIMARLPWDRSSSSQLSWRSFTKAVGAAWPRSKTRSEWRSHWPVRCGSGALVLMHLLHDPFLVVLRPPWIVVPYLVWRCLEGLQHQTMTALHSAYSCICTYTPKAPACTCTVCHIP